MKEVLSEAISPVNLPFTLLLGVVMVYWLLVALGALGAHDGPDAEGDFAADDGWFSSMFRFINLGEAPLMVLLSIFSLCLWVGSLIANHYFTGHQPLLALAFLLPNFLVGVIVTRYLTLLLRPVFHLLRSHDDEALPLVGQSCRITTSTANETFGQAEIATKGAPLLIDVRTLNGATLPRGATAVIFREDAERGVYFVVEVSDPQLP